MAEVIQIVLVVRETKFVGAVREPLAQRVFVGRGQVQVVGVNVSRVTSFRTASSSYGAWHLVHVSPALAPETRRKR